MTGHSLKDKLTAWLKLSRPPFHIVGILPFLLGTLLAYKAEGVFDGTVFSLGLAGVILVMLCTYHAGEYFDFEGDALAEKIHSSKFAGGSRVLQAGILPPGVALWTSFISVALAGLIGLILQFGLKTGPYTILLGSLGVFPGFFYSTRPVRLVERGIGEILIGFCYGWLPIATAYYIQTGYIHSIIHWIGLPIGFTIFNVVLLNEFPDYRADKAVGKRNLLVRAGMKGGSALYSLASVLAWVSMLLSIRLGVPAKALYVYSPVMALSAVLTLMVLFRRYEDQHLLERLCGLNLVLNVGTTISYVFAFA